MKQARKEQIAKLHRENIVSAATELFEKKGIQKTSMDDIAKTAHYSKATLYVYFQSKEEIIAAIVLQGMKGLTTQIAKALEEPTDYVSQFEMIGFAMAQFYLDYPSGFDIGFLNEITVSNEEQGQIYLEILKVQSGIYILIEDFLKEGVRQNLISQNVSIEQAVITFTAQLIGIVQMAEKRQEFIRQMLRISKEEFLRNSFEMMLNSVLREEAKIM